MGEQSTEYGWTGQNNGVLRVFPLYSVISTNSVLTRDRTAACAQLWVRGSLEKRHRVARDVGSGVEKSEQSRPLSGTPYESSGEHGKGRPDSGFMENMAQNPPRAKTWQIRCGF